MTTLTAGKEIAQRAPTLLVENRLAPGGWAFQLVAVDNDGNTSAPQKLTVNVIRRIVLPPPPSGGGRTVPGGPLNPRIIDTIPIVDGRVLTPGGIRPVLDPHVIVRRPG